MRYFKKIALNIVRACFLSIMLLLVANCLSAQDASKIPGLKQDLVKAVNDSDRVEALAQLCFNYANENSDTALLLGEQALQLASKINYTRGIADCYNNIGWVFYIKANMTKAEEYFKTSIVLFKKAGLENLIKMPLANLGTLYMDQTEYGKSLNCFMQVLRYEDESVDKGETYVQVNKAATLHEIGRLYNLMKKPGEAKNYFRQALQISRSINSAAYIGENLMSIGNTYQFENDDQNALKYYNESLKVLQRAGDNYRVGLTHENMANSYLHMKNNIEAIRQFKLAMEHYSIIKSKTDMFFACMGLAAVYIEVKDSTNGLAVLNEALQYAMLLNNKSFQQQAVLAFSEFYKEHNDYKKAYEYLDSSYKIKDSLFTREKQNELVKLQTQFETERKEKQIELLKKDQLLNLASLQKNKTFQYAAYIIAGLLVLTGLLVINRYRSVQRAKRLTEIDQMRNNIARDLHDDIGSTLTSINILSKVALQQAGVANGSTRNIQKIKERSADIMERMNDIVWAINPANDALDKIILRMKEFGAETLEQANMQFIFKEEGALNDVKLSLAQRSNLYLIFKEAVNNAVKYSGAKEVNILLQKDPGNLILKITDDGKGFDALGQYSGNGLKNMLSRSLDMKGLLQLESMAGSGTTIYLTVSIT